MRKGRDVVQKCVCPVNGPHSPSPGGDSSSDGCESTSSSSHLTFPKQPRFGLPDHPRTKALAPGPGRYRCGEVLGGGWVPLSISEPGTHLPSDVACVDIQATVGLTMISWGEVHCQARVNSGGGGGGVVSHAERELSVTHCHQHLEEKAVH